jgi:exosortase/archaeosortase family protein
VQTPNKQSARKSKTAEPIIRRSAVFLVSFVIFSGIIGPRIISHGLVNKYGFEIYGGAGKALLFGTLALLLLIRRKQTHLQLPAWRSINALWAMGAVIATTLEWQVIGKLITHHAGIIWPLLAHTLIITIVGCTLCFSFGLKSLRILYTAYRNELALSLGMAILFFGFLYAVYGLWTVLASAVLSSVRYLLKFTGIQAQYIPPRMLLFNKFAVTISEFCSGIDSVALFTSLYTLIGVLDWQRFNHRKYLAAFIPALVFLFGFNIIRVFGLILGGYYINPQIAFSLFHTYAGMVLFVIYSLIFWTASYSWMLKKQTT